jgi:hypothetical protein
LSFDQLFFLALASPPIVMAVAIRLALPSPRKEIIQKILFAFLAPLIGMGLFLIFAYRWWDAGATSGVVHIIGVAVFISVLVIVLRRAIAPRLGKIVLGIIAIPCWGVLWLAFAFILGCMMGNCL